MMTYCQNCGRALSAQADVCPNCNKAAGKEKNLPAADPAGRPEGGRTYWFTNVFWYHYKYHTAAAVFILTVIAFTVYSSVTAQAPDFMFIIASEQPVSDAQGETLSEFWADTVEGISRLNYSVLYLSDANEYAMTGFQQLQIGLISEDFVLFIVGQSMAYMFTDILDNFYTAEEMGLPSAGPHPEMVLLSGIPMMEELYFVFEPMYALVKRPYHDRGGSAMPDSAERSEMAAGCLKALFGDMA